jgi:hypothetical protein
MIFISALGLPDLQLFDGVFNLQLLSWRLKVVPAFRTLKIKIELLLIFENQEIIFISS